MEPNVIVLYAGLALLVCGLAIFVFKKAQPDALNTIRIPGWFEFEMHTPAVAIMGLGALLSLAGVYLTSAATRNAAIDKGLIGAWTGETAFKSFTFNLRFNFEQDGSFSRVYDTRESGPIVVRDSKISLPDSDLFTSQYTFSFSDANTMRVSDKTAYTKFVRTNSAPDLRNLLLGEWKGKIFIMGAMWDWTFNVESASAYQSFFQARDAGSFSTLNGELGLNSSWSAEPLSGSYKVLSHDRITLTTYPFPQFDLHRL